MKVINRFKTLFISALILFLMIIGAWLRVSNLEKAPYWMDEGYTILATQAIEAKGEAILDSDQTYFCPIYCYPSAFLAKVFGQTPFAYRLFSVLAGILLILIIFLIAKDLFGLPVALFSAFFMTFSYWQIAWSRQARWYTLFAALFWAAILFFMRASKRGKLSLLYFSASLVCGVLAIYTHRLALTLISPFLLWLLVVAYQQIKQKKIAADTKGHKLIYIFSGLAIIFILFIGAKSFLPGLYQKISLSYELPYYLSFYLRHYWLFFVLAFYYLYQAEKKESGPIWLLLVVSAAFIIPLAFFTEYVQYRYLFHLTPTLIMLGSAGLYSLSNLLKPIAAQLAVIIIIAAIFFLSGEGVLFARPFYLLEADTAATVGQRPFYAYTPQPNFNEAYSYIKSRKKEGEITISTYAHFSKIFLGESGYWLAFSYTGDDGPVAKNATDYYTNAPSIRSIEELENLTRNHHGYIVFDYMARGRLPVEIVSHVENRLKLVFYDKINSYSQIWVYKF